MAAASLGQVHRAVLRTGRPVAVKVQRPGIQERILKDLEVLEEIAETADEHIEAGRRFGWIPTSIPTPPSAVTRRRSRASGC